MQSWLTYKTTLHAAHYLPCHQGKCRNLHGHSYKLEIAFRPESNSPMCDWKTCDSMIMDFASAKATINRLIDDLDHANLNDVMPEPTLEQLAMTIYKRLSKAKLEIRYIKISETDSCGVLLEM
jgi:6-pyruvoyltetrahydropterin/6-carboxytetrahydropterin synthase